jgi:hypothetical protein
MAALCATCGGKRNHGVHLRALSMPGYHEYLDGTRAGLRAVSAGREAYQQSQAHKDAYEEFKGATGCLPHAHDAPGECRGELSPHHVVPRSVAASLELADLWPVIPTCTGFNGAVEVVPEVRTWAEHHTFTWLRDGHEYFFRYNQRMYRAALAQLGARI